MEEIELAEAIAQLRHEVTRAMVVGADEDLRFQVGEIVMTFQVAVERTVGGEGGLKFWVIQAGGKVSQGTTSTHTITIPLTPRRRDGSPILTSDDIIPG